MPGHEWIGKEEEAALAEIFRDGGVLFAHGYDAKRKGIYRVRRFEKSFASAMGAPHATAVNSGTAALKVALKAAGVGPGDEVITQSFTFIATAESILDCGARPVMTNVDSFLNMDPRDLEKRITKKTKAIIPVHMHGFSADLTSILEVARARKIPVIEDACQGVGGFFDGKALGTLGDLGCYSFDYNKVITTGEGGMVVTSSDRHGKFAREYHDHGHENNPSLPRGRDTRSIYGFNYRMTEMQAAVGLAQLEKLKPMLEEYKKRYDALVSEISKTIPVHPVHPRSRPVHDTVMMEISDEKLMKQTVEKLAASGAGTKNLPDAVLWHFAGYWDHILTQEEIRSLSPTASKLARTVAIPIYLSKNPEFYGNLGQELARIFKK